MQHIVKHMLGPRIFNGQELAGRNSYELNHVLTDKLHYHSGPTDNQNTLPSDPFRGLITSSLVCANPADERIALGFPYDRIHMRQDSWDPAIRYRCKVLSCWRTGCDREQRVDISRSEIEEITGTVLFYSARPMVLRTMFNEVQVDGEIELIMLFPTNQGTIILRCDRAKALTIQYSGNNTLTLEWGANVRGVVRMSKVTVVSAGAIINHLGIEVELLAPSSGE